jgi:RuvA, C-terminal domain
MTATDAFHIFLGAALVAVGVLIAALADRIRSVRSTKEAAPRERESRVQSAPTPVVEWRRADKLHGPASKQQRSARTESKVQAGATDGADDVIAALVSAGYKKPIAAEATWACSSAERASVEDWTRAALRRCARGAMS